MSKCDPMYLAGSAVFLVGSLLYFLDALIRTGKEFYKPVNLPYVLGGLLFVIGCALFCMNACGFYFGVFNLNES